MSNFFRFFAMHFEDYGLKRLITTCYKNQDVDLFSTQQSEQAVYLVYDGDKNGNGEVDVNELDIRPLKGDGDFRSKECIALLEQADIVVTNPPFSLFREYVAQLMKYQKKFLILGNINSLHYADIFPLIRDNKMWVGVSIKSGDREFEIPTSYISDSPSLRICDGHKFVRVPGVRWFTNLENKDRHEPMILYRKYNENDYIKYDNFDAINVDKMENIPYDYDGIMGVPDSILSFYCPEQFEIIGIGSGELAKSIGVTKNYRGRCDIAYTINGIHKCPYSRILIRRKQ